VYEQLAELEERFGHPDRAAEARAQAGHARGAPRAGRSGAGCLPGADQVHQGQASPPKERQWPACWVRLVVRSPTCDVGVGLS
jgi:hypothetical protein